MLIRTADIGHGAMDVPADNPNTFDLSPEQQQTSALLKQVLGDAISDRYVDFCRLTASAFALRVATPLAAHALRELESTLRQTLVVPFEAQPVEPTDLKDKLTAARKALRDIGFENDPVETALKQLEPRFSHKKQIKQIALRLGFAADSDVVKNWSRIAGATDKVHERPFDRALIVDDTFRADWMRPFEQVVREIATALPRRYSALMQRVTEITSMQDKKQALKQYVREIPGAMPLQWHFFQNLKTADWLPELLRLELIREPYATSDDPTTGQIRFREWPVGHYLREMARSDDAATHGLVVQAIRAVAATRHPDVCQGGFQILAELPPNQSGKLADVAAGWLDPETPHFGLQDAAVLVRRLSEAGETQPAIAVARALFQIFEVDGEAASLHSRFMYEHTLPPLAEALTRACRIPALKLLSDLLYQAAILGRRIVKEPASDHSDATVHPIAESEGQKHDIFSALIAAVVNSANVLVQDPSAAQDALGVLSAYPYRIFKRILLHVLSRNPRSEPALVATLLKDAELIEAYWCQEEYAQLAVAWFPSLSRDEQASIFNVIDGMSERRLPQWRKRFEEHNGRSPDKEDEDKFRLSITRDAMWYWRSALPPERRENVEEIGRQLGDPDAWKNSFGLENDESPLDDTDFGARTCNEIAAFLETWRPGTDPQSETANALAQQLRNAAENNPSKFSEGADRFARVPAIYVRRLFEGLKVVVDRQGALAWRPVLDLIAVALSKVHAPIGPSESFQGNDPSWVWVYTAAAELLKSGMGLAPRTVDQSHEGQLRSLMLEFLKNAPKEPDIEDFEDRYARNAFFGAEMTMRGAAVQLCVLFLFWQSKQPGSKLNDTPRAAFATFADVGNALLDQLTDRSPSGRIPRAVIGKFLTWLFFFDADWLRTQLPALFPPEQENLREAAWLGHLLSDRHPIVELFDALGPSYLAELAHLRSGARGREADYREDRFGEYLLVLHLRDALPADLLDNFLTAAPSRLRQHLIWYLGTLLGHPPDKLPSDMRARGLAYWEARLSHARKSPTSDEYREELGAISEWCHHRHIDTDWLIDQISLMLKSGFAPTHGYQVVLWVAAFASSKRAKAAELLDALFSHPRIDRWTYLTHKDAIRAALTEARVDADPTTIAHVDNIVSVLATVGETGYLALASKPPRA